MNAVFLTWKSSKRSGVFPIMLAIGALGAVYASVFNETQGRGLPPLTLILLISSIIRNIWITIGIGIAGFFSMMAMGDGINKLFYLNPF